MNALSSSRTDSSRLDTRIGLSVSVFYDHGFVCVGFNRLLVKYFSNVTFFTIDV
jgi:hypothetical protein